MRGHQCGHCIMSTVAFGAAAADFVVADCGVGGGCDGEFKELSMAGVIIRMIRVARVEVRLTSLI